MSDSKNYTVIQPAPRKPLHSSCKNCCLTPSLLPQESMGGYGIPPKKHRNLERTEVQTSKSYDGGIDEVDNNQSKHQLSIAKFSKRNFSVEDINSLVKRQGIQTSKDFDTDDQSDENNSTEEFEDDVNNYENEFTLESNRPFPANIHSRKLSQNGPDKNKKMYFKQYFIYSSIGIFIIAVICKLNFSSESIIYDKSKFFNDVTNLGQKYKVSGNSILQIKSGIATIFHREDTGSFIFTYNNLSPNFDPILFNNFMNELTSSTARFLRNSYNIQDAVIVDSPKLDMQVHSELIEKYKENVTRTGVMLVKDLDEVPSYLAMAFHYYCDEFDPLIKKSAIFFTLNMAKCSDTKTSHASIEKCLEKKWTTVPKDNIVPLLTRVVGVIVNIYL